MHDIDSVKGARLVGNGQGEASGRSQLERDPDAELNEVAEGQQMGGLSQLLGAVGGIVTGGADWAIVQLALVRGIRDENRLTDIAFLRRHPERRGRPIRPEELQLRREWLDLRDRIVRPAMHTGPGTPPTASTTTPTAPGAGVTSAVPGGTGALDALRPLVGRSTAATVPNAMAILRALCAYWGVPLQLPFTLLQHEGGLRLFQHHDGVMQTTASARESVIPILPRPLKLVLLGLPAGDVTADDRLTQALQREFPHSLAVQIAAGTQELVSNLSRFNGYVALAFVAYNAGAGSAYWVATGRSPKVMPRPSGEEWEQTCRIGATLLHQAPGAVDVPNGVWQCDANLAVAGKPGSGWYRKYSVRDRKTGRLLISYQYLRSVRSCVRAGPPTIPCGRNNHAHQQDGSGRLDCGSSRMGALDKLYDPAQFPSPYREVAQAVFPPIGDDGSPLKVVGGKMAKVPRASL